jgi:hypothetical protein
MSSVQQPEKAQVGRWGGRVTGGGPTWLRVAVIAAVLVVAFIAAQTCQKSQIRVDKEQAIATAEQRIDFTSERTQIRLLRQGITSKPYWIVSLSIPTDEKNVFRELALVKIDANTGKVDSVKTQR